ncbi:VOC family protein [Vibrio gazogenes]|uniref:Glyoxylase I family protein n=1 Tax=Vibrio gazogenes DSM 21264 = NBRC 103151 TaxID=1123492 RepID=A0A1M5HL54_VIBGA|nr:VOC family protein [Vibrio gazogenes]USP14502.1 VOC family protein [Vibrio gazogenes]SHG16628.1 glyoxylase I family protein [Vibrio gazogenes DSM 21264] [Vibrio gazogenes DSM 21264 = NBRC 103151]SJN57660.1 Glyoxalase-like domain protein [Vibrio gazogenes]
MSGCLHHVSLTCRDLGKSQRFYGQFGYTTLKSYTDEQVSIVIMTSESGPAIELFCFTLLKYDHPSASHIDTMPNIQSIGITHIAIQVDDITATRQQLAKSSPCTEIKTARLGGFVYFFTHDPDGNQVEIIMEH